MADDLAVLDAIGWWSIRCIDLPRGRRYMCTIRPKAHGPQVRVTAAYWPEAIEAAITLSNRPGRKRGPHGRR